MAVRIRFRPLELMTVGEEVVVKAATRYVILEDNTVELLAGRRRIGHIHRDRWDSVVLLDEAPGRSRPAPGSGQAKA